MNRSEIEARARAEALVRDEQARWEALQPELAALRAQARWPRKVAAAAAGSRLAGILAGDGRAKSNRSDAGRTAANLRRRRFRLAREKRVLGHGAGDPPRLVDRGPLWLTEISPGSVADQGPALRRRRLADLLAGENPGGRPARVLVDPDCPPAIAQNVSELGLERVTNAANADVAILTREDGTLGIDWILAGERSSASAGVLDGTATALGEALARGAEAMTFCIRIACRDWAAANEGGDAALARSLAHALGRRGHQALIQVDAEAGQPLADCLDVLLVLRGRPSGEPTPGRINLIWQISHPQETSASELDRYDRVLVASTRHAKRLRRTVKRPVDVMLQFTDPELFRPDPEASLKHDVAFVGNWRGEFRRVVWDAIEAGYPPALYGRGWDLLAPEHAVAEHVPHEELYRLYSSCEILLCDHWDDMRRCGFVSNRVFDALACGTFVIVDDNPALAEELPGAAVTYSSPTELGEKIERYLADPKARERIASRGREITLAEHTADHRAELLLTIAKRARNARATRRAAGASAEAEKPREADTGPA